MRLDTFFYNQPVFTGEELAEFLSLNGKCGQRTQEALLAYHKKTGRIIRVRRGLYAVIPPGADPKTYPIDPFVLAAKMTQDAILAYHTALEFHGKAYSAWEYLTYLSRKPVRSLNFRYQLFRGTKFSKSLILKGKEDYGTVNMERMGIEVRVTSLERTLVDLLDRPNLSGSWEEIWRSLETVEFFDFDKVIEYTMLLGNATTAARVGFFLEQHRKMLMVEDEHLKPLRNLKPEQPHYLDRKKRQKGRLITDWNLIVPTEIIDRTWEEVL